MTSQQAPMFKFTGSLKMQSQILMVASVVVMLILLCTDDAERVKVMDDEMRCNVCNFELW